MGFLFIKSNANNETVHIFPAFYGTDAKYHTFSDEKCKDSIEWIEDIISNKDKIKDVDLVNNKAICHGDGVTLANMGIVNDDNKKYCETIDKAIEYSAIFQNNNLDMCANCVKRLYKD